MNYFCKKLIIVLFVGNPDATWETGYCFNKMAFVCQIPLHTAPATVNPSSKYIIIVCVQVCFDLSILNDLR